MYMKNCSARFNRVVSMPSPGQDQLLLLQASLHYKSIPHAPQAVKIEMEKLSVQHIPLFWIPAG